MTTLSLPIDLEPLLAQALAEACRLYVAQLPLPDPQYTVPQIAEVLNLDPATVRGYLTLPYGHPRRLRYVDTTGTAHGFRIRHSDIIAWQERNLAQLPADMLWPPTRPARRRRGA